MGGNKMVREYNKNDIDAIIRLFDLHNELSEVEEKEKRKELEDGAKVLVYEDNGGIKGICSFRFWKSLEWGSCAEIIMSVEENCEFNEVVNSLWESVQALLEEKEVVFISTHYNEKYNELRDFYSQKQFEKWFGVHGMIYKGGRCEETKLTFRNYEESDFDEYYSYLGESFSVMRKANDIRPFNIFKGSSPEKIEKLKKEMIEVKNSTYLFYDSENLVGSSMIKHEEIDDIFVIPEYQGKGYGRKLVEATLNLALQRNFDKITLGAVAWNTVAINLYKSLGFEIYQSFEYRRLILNRD
jgi:ribosomal protein S18 acetylase RimI-like enzyme